MNKENKNIGLLLIRGQTTNLGNIIFDYGNKLLIAGLALNANFFMTFYQSSEALIRLIFNLFAGHLADFGNRKRLLLATDLIAGALTFLLFLCYDPQNIWALIIINALLAVLFSFNVPAYKAITKDLLSQKGIYRYNATAKVIAELIAVAAPLLAMLVIKQFGFKYGMLIDALSFFISALCEGNFVILHEVPAAKATFLTGLKAGIHYIASRKGLLIILISSAFLNFLDAIYSFYLPFTATFSGFSHIYAYILIAQSLGSVLGALLVSIYKIQLAPKSFFHLLLPASLALILIGFARSSQPLLLLLFGLFSSTVTTFNISLMSYLQASVDSRFLGRVFSIIFTISGIFIPLGSVVAALIDFKSWQIFQLIGCGQLLIYLVCFPAIRRIMS
ncbi:MFS transporter [Lapidilactobacillus achengensis]|uniref:MFS transporter n=1 Tax=Lapidilactobacillus achengensis TaxID=2486000 RepID=A0ABW1UJN9_9LACO|nr:MFS transporter [Lapidilactobacillus achengensis]